MDRQESSGRGCRQESNRSQWAVCHPQPSCPWPMPRNKYCWSCHRQDSRRTRYVIGPHNDHRCSQSIPCLCIQQPRQAETGWVDTVALAFCQSIWRHWRVTYTWYCLGCICLTCGPFLPLKLSLAYYQSISLLVVKLEALDVVVDIVEVIGELHVVAEHGL